MTRRLRSTIMLAAFPALLALTPATPGAAASAAVPPLPVGLPPPPTAPPLPVLNIAPPPVPATVGTGTAAGLPQSGSVGAPPAGDAALQALGDPTALLPGQDPAPRDPRYDGSQGPNDNRGLSAQSREFDRQQYVITAQMNALGASQDAAEAVFAGGGSGRFAWPERYRTISQGFGCTSVRQAPTSGSCPSGHFHTGLDVAGPDQSGVYAADTGVARVFHGTTGYGNYVILTHGNGYATLYGHLHDLAVTDGQLVQRGDLIAHEGTTGNSTGPHLHFEIRQQGGYLDPCPFLEGCTGY